MTQTVGSATNDNMLVQKLLSDSEFWNTLSDAEQQKLRDIASKLDAATGSAPGTAIGAIVAAVNKNRKALR